MIRNSNIPISCAESWQFGESQTRDCYELTLSLQGRTISTLWRLIRVIGFISECYLSICASTNQGGTAGIVNQPLVPSQRSWGWEVLYILWYSSSMSTCYVKLME